MLMPIKTKQLNISNLTLT